MAKHTIKILRCEHRKIFKYVWSFYNIMHERANGMIHTKLWLDMIFFVAFIFLYSFLFLVAELRIVEI